MKKSKVKKYKAKILTIKVTRKHISDGEVGSVAYCPIAYALQARGLEGVEVGTSISFEDPKTTMPLKFKSPKCIKSFIERFDNTSLNDETGEDDRHKRVKPFSFKIKLPLTIPGGISC